MPDALNARGPRAAATAWDRFFFAPADPTPLGLMRIATGLLLLWSFGCLAPDLHAFLGSGGWDDPEVVQLLAREHESWEWSFWYWVPDRLLWPAWGLAMAALAAFTLGFRTRASAVLAWVVVVSTARRAPDILFGFDQMVSIWTFYLAASGAGGQALSLDRFLALRRRAVRRADLADAPAPTTSANVALRLIQVHLCIIYGIAGLSKLRGESWWNGSALIKLLANAEFRPFDLTGILAWPGAESALNLATHVALFAEVFYPALVWSRPLRPWVVGLALLIHAGIALTLGLGEFSMAMAAGNLAFVSGPWARRWLSGREGMAPPGDRV